ncbi:hypothetical protein [Coleofasciculus chthonoplastes]|uniref:hypothetical protein n=1 Tax=Coleofasciculus chthonoplastes TaxID=64178 RepID=UPI0012FC8225|nr:hypothetical protein [Coleofasciculus chthonoplastes]
MSRVTGIKSSLPRFSGFSRDEGDIKIINSADTLKAKQLIQEIHQQFNQNDSISGKATVTSTSNPHLEIKTQYLVITDMR